MGCFEGRGVPVLYIGRTVPKGWSDKQTVTQLVSYVAGLLAS